MGAAREQVKSSRSKMNDLRNQFLSAKNDFQRKSHKLALLTGKAKRGQSFEDYQKEQEAKKMASASKAAAKLNAAKMAEKRAVEAEKAARAEEAKAAAANNKLKGESAKANAEAAKLK